MKKLMITFALAAAVAMAETWTGTISDAHCGAKHADASAKSASCVQSCIKGGAAPVFVAGDKVLKIANPDAVKDVQGKKVELSGELNGDTVTVAKVSPVMQ